jgi:hypothetical protein
MESAAQPYYGFQEWQGCNPSTRLSLNPGANFSIAALSAKTEKMSG